MSGQGEQVEEELAAARRELEQLRGRVAVLETGQRMMEAGVWQRDLSTGEIVVSNEFRRILGLTATGDFTLDNFVASVHPEDRALIGRVLAAGMQPSAAGLVRPYAYRLVRSDGEVRWIDACAMTEVDATGQPARLYGTVIDRTEARRAELARDEQEQLFRTVLEQVSDAIFVASPEGRFLALNDRGCELLGYSRDELNGMSIVDVIEPEELRVRPVELGALTEAVTRTERRLRRKDGERREVEIAATRLPNGQSAAVVHDVTERRKADQALRASEQMLREMEANLPVVLMIRDAHTGALLHANKAWESLLGQPVRIGEHYSQLFATIHADERDVVADGMARAADTPFDREIRVVPPGSDVPLYFRLRAFPIVDARGEPSRVAAVGENVTGIHARLREKEILLREIHHRVRNNLQIVSSLLHLQASKTNDPRVSAPLTESQHRVMSMVLIHQLLYQTSPDLAQIAFAPYARDLGASLMRSFGVATVEYVVDAGDLMLPLPFAVPCGLILNELLTNALKHAFPGGRSGTLHVSLRGSHESYTLVIEDDGVGLPADYEQRRQASLGSTLVDRLVEQLGGDLVRTSGDAGTRYEVCFVAT